jgi:hypothetical protein
MNNSNLYISLFSMVADKKGYIRLFFKVLLLAVYFAFFSVQLFLRYSSSHALQSLDLDNYKRVVASKNVLYGETVSAKDTKKSKVLSYLNKRFHPQDAVNIPVNNFDVQAVFAACKNIFYTTDKYFTSLTIRSSSLRGPPAVA